jgi:hypothetical protein
MTLAEAVDRARQKAIAEGRGCSACEVGDRPVRGLHRGVHRCSNYRTCTACKGAWDMEIGDYCRACGRKKVEDEP